MSNKSGSIFKKSVHYCRDTYPCRHTPISIKFNGKRKPLMDLAYFPIQFKVIDLVSPIEKRGEFAYILNHEAGLYMGSFPGAGTFLLLAHFISTEITLRYAIIIIAALQLCSIFVAKNSIEHGKVLTTEEETMAMKVLSEVAEVNV